MHGLAIVASLWKLDGDLGRHVGENVGGVGQVKIIMSGHTLHSLLAQRRCIISVNAGLHRYTTGRLVAAGARGIHYNGGASYLLAGA